MAITAYSSYPASIIRLRVARALNPDRTAAAHVVGPPGPASASTIRPDPATTVIDMGLRAAPRRSPLYAGSPAWTAARQFPSASKALAL